MSFEDDVGSALDAFKAGFKTHRLAHAFLIVGNPAGAAGWLAEQMLCVLCCKSAGPRPCLECAGCGKVLQRSHPDMMWVEPGKKSRTIQKEQVEAIEEHIFRTSYEGGWKAVVFLEADRMNDVVANALLKAMEEPPSASMFLLVSSAPDRLLPTVLSRCQKIVARDRGDVAAFRGGRRGAEDMSFLSEERMCAAVADVMKNKLLPGGGVIIGAALARDLLAILKDAKRKLEEEEKARFTELLGQTGGKDDMKDILAARIEGRYVAAREGLLRGLLFWCRDMLLAVSGADAESFYFKNERDLIRKISAGLTWQQAMNNIHVVEDMKMYLGQYISESMVFERAMMELKLGN